MQRIKDLRAEKKQNNLFQTVIWKNMLYNRKETILLIICEMLIVAIAYSGSMCYQILSANISDMEAHQFQNGNINVRYQEDDLDRSRYLLCGRNVHWFLCGKRDVLDIPEIYYRYGRYRREGRQLFKAYVSGDLSVFFWNLRTEFSAYERTGSRF